MFLKLEGEIPVNISLVEKVEFIEHRQEAVLWAGGVVLHPGSRIAYDYFRNDPPEGLYINPGKASA